MEGQKKSVSKPFSILKDKQRKKWGLKPSESYQEIEEKPAEKKAEEEPKDEAQMSAGKGAGKGAGERPEKRAAGRSERKEGLQRTGIRQATTSTAPFEEAEEGLENADAGAFDQTKGSGVQQAKTSKPKDWNKLSARKLFEECQLRKIPIAADERRKRLYIEKLKKYEAEYDAEEVSRADDIDGEGGALDEDHRVPKPGRKRALAAFADGDQVLIKGKLPECDQGNVYTVSEISSADRTVVLSNGVGKYKGKLSDIRRVPSWLDLKSGQVMFVALNAETKDEEKKIVSDFCSIWWDGVSEDVWVLVDWEGEHQQLEIVHGGDLRIGVQTANGIEEVEDEDEDES